MKRLVVGMSVAVALAGSPALAQDTGPPPPPDADTPAPVAPDAPVAEPPVAEPPVAEPPVAQPPAAPPPVAPPPASWPAPTAPPPGWGAPAPGWAPPPPGLGRRRDVPPPLAEPGPYYADVAGWSSVLSTLIPMFGGFVLVATAQRDDSSFQADDEEIGMQAAGFALVGAGLIVGPSVGHLYADDLLWGLGGMGLRLVALGGGAGFLAGGFLLLEEDDDAAEGVVLMALAAIGGASGIGLAIVDLFDAPEAARRKNRELEKKRPSTTPDVQIGIGSLSMRWTY